MATKQAGREEAETDDGRRGGTREVWRGKGKRKGQKEEGVRRVATGGGWSGLGAR